MPRHQSPRRGSLTRNGAELTHQRLLQVRATRAALASKAVLFHMITDGFDPARMARGLPNVVP